MTAPTDALADEAFETTYPLYEMARMRATTSPRRTDTVGFPGEREDTPLRWCNVFVHARKLLTAGKSRVVTPNNDTLYTNAWLDLGRGPLVIDVPDTAGRYYVLGFLDFWTNPFAHIGQRLTGTGARSFLVTGPDWHGELPEAFRAPGAHVASPTRWVWIIGRTIVQGPEDVPAVHALQDRFVLRTLSDWRAGLAPRPLAFDPGPARAPMPDARTYAAVVCEALRGSPPAAGERERVARYAALGLAADAPALDDATAERLSAAIARGLARLRDTEFDGRAQGGWRHMPVLGTSFGTDYAKRALVALKYIGALESLEATYPMAHRDSNGEPLTGRHAYRIRFAPGALPPVDAFWSMTMYDARDYMLVPNAIERYSIGDRTPGLVRDADGGLTIHLRHGEPADAAARANWLPAPEAGFYLCLRAYIPRPEMLDGRYDLPSIERVG